MVIPNLEFFLDTVLDPGSLKRVDTERKQINLLVELRRAVGAKCFRNSVEKIIFQLQSSKRLLLDDYIVLVKLLVDAFYRLWSDTI